MDRQVVGKYQSNWSQSMGNRGEVVWKMDLTKEQPTMIAVHCHVHGSDVLLGWSQLEGLRHTVDGPAIDWHCWCGARGSLLAGRRSVPRPDVPEVIDLTGRDESAPLGA